jgi:uncharacterized protein YjbI with pentapeptide repeats
MKKFRVLIALLASFLILTLSISYISSSYKRGGLTEVVKINFIRTAILEIAKVAVPLKNNILLRSVNDKINLLKLSNSCNFCVLTQGNLKGSDLKDADLRYAILIEADLSNTNLSGANLRNVDFTGANFTGADLTNTDLAGATFTNANLEGANLANTDFSNKDLTGTIFTNANLEGANLANTDLSNKDLTGTIFIESILKGANLAGAIMTNTDLTRANLSDVDLSKTDLTLAIIESNVIINLVIKNPNYSNWPGINETKDLYVSRYDLNENVQYIATKNGFLFESKNDQVRLVLDLSSESHSSAPFAENPAGGLLGVASKNNLVYVAYSTLDPITKINSLVVDEYSKNFTQVKNIIQIDKFANANHFGGDLMFDQKGQLYLATGDGTINDNFSDDEGSQGNFLAVQDLNDYRGKILRLDTSDLKLNPEIIAYGIRSPWGVSIDLEDRMFVPDCGNASVEKVFLLNDLYSGTPINLGWPIFEGSKRMVEHPLTLDDVLAPIFETTVRPGCMTGGFYFKEIESYVFSDFFGTIRLLKQKANGDWYLLHEEVQKDPIWGMNLDKKTNKIFLSPDSRELEILIN